MLSSINNAVGQKISFGKRVKNPPTKELYQAFQEMDLANRVSRSDDYAELRKLFPDYNPSSFYTLVTRWKKRQTNVSCSKQAPLPPSSRQLTPRIYRNGSFTFTWPLR
jgi:hypothetical protein